MTPTWSSMRPAVALATPLWLDGLGYGRPTEEKITIGVGYASATFRLAPGTLGHDLAIINTPTPAHPRGGGLSALESDQSS